MAVTTNTQIQLTGSEPSSQWESEGNVTLWVGLFTIIVASTAERITGIDPISVKEDYPIQGLPHAESLYCPLLGQGEII